VAAARTLFTYARWLFISGTEIGLGVFFDLFGCITHRFSVLHPPGSGDHASVHGAPLTVAAK